MPRNLWVLFALFPATCLALGNPDAPQAGTFQKRMTSFPTTLNALTSTDAGAREVYSFGYEGLLFNNPDTYEWMPALATEWKIHDDGLTYDFTLREDVKWHDGKPLRPQDVCFSFNAIKSGDYSTAHKLPYFENIQKCQILEGNKIRFQANKKYFQNFAVVASGGFMPIIPQHLYAKKDDETVSWLNKNIVGTGPYKLETFDRKKGITLVKNDNWWGRKVYSGRHNFEKIFFRLVKENALALEYFQKQRIDFMGLTPQDFVKKAKGGDWGKEYKKYKVSNKAPKGYGFIGWNLKDPLFQSKEVRKALNHLVNRQEMIDKFLFDLSERATGPLYKQSPYANKEVKPITFNPRKALKILRAQGWKDSDRDQILDKKIDGKKTKFQFDLLVPNKDFIKYLTIFQQDAKKVGVRLNIKLIEWNSFVKLLDERNFQAVVLAWSSGSIDWDPKQIWHSNSIKGGSNFVGYSNPEVDKLIEKSRSILDREKRIPLLKKAYRLIAQDYPYVFLFNRKFDLYGRNNRVGAKKDTYTYGLGETYWWIRP